MSLPVKPILAIVLFLFATGCSHTHEHRSRGSLKDAMRVAAGKEDKLPSMDGRDSYDSRYEPEYESTSDDQYVSYSSNASSEKGKGRLGLKVSSIPVRNSEIEMVRQTSVYAESSEHNAAFGAAFSMGSYEFTPHSLQEEATHNAFSYGWSVYLKGYTNPKWVFVSPYLLVGFGVGEFRWSYARPVVVGDGSEIISDSLGYTDFEFGVGGEVARSYGVGLSLSASALWRIYSYQTREGFDNDMFSDHFTSKFGVSLTGTF